jgi:acyl-CoA thioesterase I
MKTLIAIYAVPIFILLGFLSCSNSEEVATTPVIEEAFTYLALGDSYTIGESVSATQNFPFQLQDSLSKSLNDVGAYKIIAQTGWTTTNLLTAIESQNPTNDYDLVTLLIGVNNQFQGKPFALYEQEFPQLVDKAIEFARGDKNRVIIVSIPDYAFTPFGKNTNYPQQISDEIDQYNAYAQEIAMQKGVAFQNITDITRQGLEDPSLVASDGLHPSAKAYKLFVDLLFPKAKQGID